MTFFSFRSVSRPSLKGPFPKTSVGRFALLFALTVSMLVVSSSASPNVSHALNSDGLVFQDFDETGESWAVTGCDGACADPVVIPSIVNGKPVVGIGSSAFWYDQTLAEVQIPASVTTISGYAFGGSSATKFEVDPLSQHFKSMNETLMTKDGTEIVAYPGGATATSVTVPSGVTKLRMGSFFSGPITSVSLPSSLEVIEQQAFGLAGLSTIELPISLSTIGEDAFGSSMTAISVAEGNVNFSAIDGVLFRGNELFQYPRAKTAITYQIPAGTTAIANTALDRNSVLTSISLPISLTSFTSNPLRGLSILQSVDVEAGHPTLSAIDGVLFNGNELFMYPPGKTAITYQIPAGTTAIANNAFSANSALTSISLPISLTSFTSNPLGGLPRLESVDVEAGHPTLSAIDGVFFRGSALVTYPKARTGTTYSVPAGTTEIGDSAFVSTPTLTTITLPDSVTVIGSEAFAYSPRLANINLPSGLMSLGSYALYAIKITSIVVPHTVNNWGWQPFGSNQNPPGTAFDIYFEGDAPPEGFNLDLLSGAIIHRIEGTNGWPALSDTYLGYAQAAWDPEITTPRAPSVTALAQSVRVTANRGSGGLPTSYLVTASPEGRSCTIATGETSCVVTDLTGGTPYTFTTKATKGATTTASSLASTAVNPLSSQTISFADPADREFATTPFTVTATSNSNLSVTLTSTTPDVCTASGFNVSMLTTGTCTLTASEAGNSTFAAAIDVVHSFTITPALEAPAPAPAAAPPAAVAPAVVAPPVAIVTTTPVVSAVGTSVSISREPSAAVATAVAIGVSKTKVMVALKVPKASKPANQVTKYVIQLKSAKGAIITKTISVRPGGTVKPMLTGKKKTSYSMTVTAVTKSGKKTTWKGPQVKTS
jgi:hypothetical protein